MGIFNKIGKEFSSIFTKSKALNGGVGKKLSSSAYTNSAIPAGSRLDEELSSNGNRVYVDRTGHATVAYAGTKTDKKNIWKDLGADALLALGLEKYSNRFKKGVRTAEAARAKYGADKTSLVGHSLGGAIANYASSRTGLKGEAFNAGYGLSAFNPSSYLKKSKVVTHNTITDPISAIGLVSHAIGTNKAKTDVWKGKVGHGIDSN